MSSVRPPKRPKLQHPGSRSNPISIDDDESSSEADDLHSPSPSDSLQHFLSVLDDLNRREHLATIMGQVRLATSQRDVVRTLENQSHFTALQPNFEREKDLSKTASAGGEEHDTNLQGENPSRKQSASSLYEEDHGSQDNLLDIEDTAPEHIEWLLLSGGSISVHTRPLSKALSRWVNALNELHMLWIALWDVYDAMTKPGPSSLPAKARRRWDTGHNASMWDDLVRIEADVQDARRQVEEIGGAICEEAGADA
ncbi:hypothetical protein CLAIMM_12224 [Cladophialophora immunda]|nr:hypothetical protein CLAIMM_12224 [Cladophialophora immunda]